MTTISRAQITLHVTNIPKVNITSSATLTNNMIAGDNKTGVDIAAMLYCLTNSDQIPILLFMDGHQSRYSTFDPLVSFQ